MARDENRVCLTTADVRCAIDVYLAGAYGQSVPEAIRERYAVPEGVELAQWLMSDVTERTPADADFDDVRSFALRIGNVSYPHMKLRLSRPPGRRELVLSVDAHDAMLRAPEGSPDAEILETLKATNACIGSEIRAAWEREGLMTEKTFLRQQIAQCRQEMDKDAAP
jgi:hypothetical protein